MVVDSDFQKSVTVKTKGSSFVTFQGGEISHGLKVPDSLGKSGISVILGILKWILEVLEGSRVCWALQKDGSPSPIFTILKFQLFSSESSPKHAQGCNN